MNQTLTARIETFALGNGLHLSEASRLSITEAANGINANPLNVFDTLDKVAAFLTAGLTNPVNNLGNPSHWHVHQGGHHVALSFLPNGNAGNAVRVLIVTETRPEPVFYDEGAVDAPVVDHERNFENEAQTPSVAAPQAAGTTTAVQAVVDRYRDTGRHYAAAYAHWADEVGEAAAIAHAANRGKGLTGYQKQAIRTAINAARS